MNVMRLLHIQSDGTLTFTEFSKHNIPQYAILSHTWGESEVTLQHLLDGTSSTRQGYRKIVFCGEQALKDGLKYFWVDTCCIDKRNPTELTTAINSMFRWYRNAVKCYVYLSDVSSLNSKTMKMYHSAVWMEAFQKSRWFKRGWTLQELLAPASVAFFSCEGHFLGDKSSLELKISQITAIPTSALRGQNLGSFSIQERFAWTENRKTTEEEDIAYCLLGIFDVFMALIYGEGEANARRRLKLCMGNARNEHEAETFDDVGYHSDEEISASASSSRFKDYKQSYDTSDIGSSKSREWSGKIEPDERRPRTRRAKLTRRIVVNRPELLLLSHWHRALCLSSDFAAGANVASIFQDAHVSFLDAVYWDEWPRFETFRNCSDMMTYLLSHCDTVPHSSKLQEACKHIGAFSEQMTHFFEVVGLAMELNPEWPCTLWGAISLIFMRSLNSAIIFGKLAQMFNEARQQLPCYLDHLQQPFEYRGIVKRNVGKALGFVYADVLQFCHYACGLFKMSLNASQLELELDPLTDLLSLPFAPSFDNFLRRLYEHKIIFDVHLRSGKQSSVNTFVEKVTQHLREREELVRDVGVKQKLENEKASRRRANREAARKWFLSTDFQADFNKAKEAKNPGSCAWLQLDTIYMTWKNGSQVPAAIHTDHRRSGIQTCPPILLFEGPPGYGKTILSTAIIEDLDNIASQDATTGKDRSQQQVVYFYFNAQKHGQQSFCDALRAVGIQVLDALQNDSNTTDMVSILRGRDDGNRHIATDDELQELLLLIVGKISSLTLVLDGIDECQNFEAIWPWLSTACADKRLRVLFFGRPGTSILAEHAHLVQRHMLPGTNRLDIYNFLSLKIRNMKLAGELEKDINTEHTADALASCADTSFLWASRIISYLQSPLLSLTERTSELRDPNRLATVPRLYSGMLQQFEELFPLDRIILTRIFQFLVLAKESPSIEQLDVAISIEPGPNFASNDSKASVADTLQRLCSALVEIAPDNTVFFSHLSFRTFLLSGEAKQFKTTFWIDPKTSSQWIARICLSYLVYDVPAGPLSSTLGEDVNKSELALRLPFLEYSARHWVRHAVDALELMPETLRELISDCLRLLQQLGYFISKPRSISTWIEICWTYNVQPSIEPLCRELEKRLKRHDVEDRQNSMEWHMAKPLQEIWGLSEDLKQLQQHWSHLLSVRPYEIWGTSIAAFLGPRSWAHNDEANVSIIPDERADDQYRDVILKVSKLSACGKFLGIVCIYRLSTARNKSDRGSCVCGIILCTCFKISSPVDLEEAIADFQVVEMRAGFPTVKRFCIELSEEDLREVATAADDRSFRFPISFAPNLHCISVLRTLYWIDSQENVQQQRLGPERPRRGKKAKDKIHKHTTLEKPLHMPTYLSLPSISHKPSYTRGAHYRRKFSPDLQYLAHIERQHDNNDHSMGFWDLTIWENPTIGPSVRPLSTWKRIASLKNIYGDFLHEGNLSFNPRYQVIALSEIVLSRIATNTQTSIWDFRTCPVATTKRMAYATGLRNLNFSPCGRLLSGDHFQYGTKRAIDIGRFLCHALPMPSAGQLVADEVKESNLKKKGTEGIMKRLFEAHVNSATSEPSNMLLSSDTLAIVAPDGVSELQTIRTYSDGAVVLKRFSPLVDKEECLLYLPNGTDTCISTTLLHSKEDDTETVRMVLTSNFQDTYDWDNPMIRSSTTIISRPTQSIQEHKLPQNRNLIAYRPGELANMPISKGERYQLQEHHERDLPKRKHM